MKKESVADRLVRELTAFGSFAEMRKCMDERGYVPTIHERGDAHRKLVRILRGNGYRVYTGTNLSLKL